MERPRITAMARRGRSSARVSCVGAAAVAAWCVASAVARAETSSAVSIDYAAPAGCPGAEAFTKELTARAPRAQIGARGAHARAVIVRILVRGRLFDGQLVLRDAGVETERTVSAATCAEVVSALALITAVAVDPAAAASAPSPEPAGGSSAAAPASPPSAPSSAAPMTTPAAETEPPREPTRSDAASASLPKQDVDEASAPAPRPGWAFGLGVHAGAVGGISPDPLIVVPVFVELAHEGGGLLAPAARLRFERASSGVVSAGGGAAQFTWTAGSLDLCPVALGSSSMRFSARPCGRIEAGELEGNGRDIQPARRGARPWLALGPIARGRVVLVGPLFAELEAAANIAVVRDRFYVEPDLTVFRAPFLGWTASAGAGVTFR
jgi:hypothetical protein